MIKRQREVALALVAVVVLTVAVMAYRAHTAPAPIVTGQAVPQTIAAPAAPRTDASKDSGLAELNLPSLNAPRGELPESVRDPFRFKPKPPPPPPPTIARPIATQPTAPEGPPPPPRITLKFFGTFESTKGVVAGLSDSRGVYYGHVGDTIAGRYRIVGIGVESIDLAYLDGSGRQSIRKTGQ